MAPDEPSAGRRRALLVATATYSDPGLAALRAPTGDVASLAAVLGDEAVGGFDVRELIDQPAEELRKQIETFFGDGRPQDLLLLYVSGHGVLSQSRRFYFATADTSLQLLRSTAIEDGFVNDVMQASRARSIVLVLDCCHSGAFGKGLAPKSATSVDVEHRFEGRGRVTLSASTELEYAFEESDPSGINELDPAAPGSLFTRSVVEGLSSGDADIDEDGRISVDDLYDYVCRRVRERSVHQTPGMAGDVRGQIVIARSPRRAALPPELARAVDSNLAGIRAGAVSELGTLLRADGAVATAARAALERLAEDDSRSVAAAALAALDRPPRETPPPEAPPPRETRPPEAPPPRAAPRERAPRGIPKRTTLRAGLAVLAVGVVVLAIVLLLPGGGSQDTGPSEATAYDFNGDGYQEVVAAPLNAGTAEVLVASAAPDTQPRPISAAEAGVDAGPGDSFGTGIAGGDFNGDGNADLAIGTPNFNVVSVLYGNGDGGIAHKVTISGKAKSRYGQALLARDLNDDHYTDLVVGGSGADDLKGSIEILLGGSTDLTSQRSQHLSPPRKVIDDFGFLLRSGDLNGDGHVDLVEGAPGESGHLTYCLGRVKGPPASCQALVAPDGDSETTALAVADLNADGKDDIVQSDVTLGGDKHGGGLRLWKGDSVAPEGTPRIVTPAEVTDDPAFGKPVSEFGFSVDAGVIPGDDEYADIVVGAPGYPKKDGAVVVIRGGPATIARNHPEQIVAQGFRFGSDVALLALDSSDTPNLVVVAEDAGFAKAVQYVASDGNLKPLAGFGSLVPKNEESSGLRIAHSAGAD
jgi:uncharacterized caspase-like protein